MVIGMKPRLLSVMTLLPKGVRLPPVSGEVPRPELPTAVRLLYVTKAAAPSAVTPAPPLLLAMSFARSTWAAVEATTVRKPTPVLPDAVLLLMDT